MDFQHRGLTAISRVTVKGCISLLVLRRCQSTTLLLLSPKVIDWLRNLDTFIVPGGRCAAGGNAHQMRCHISQGRAEALRQAKSLLLIFPFTSQGSRDGNRMHKASRGPPAWQELLRKGREVKVLLFFTFPFKYGCTCSPINLKKSNGTR